MPEGRGGSADAADSARILLIEDDENTAVTFTWALRSERFDVTATRTGREGLAAARRTLFDLLLVDLALPDMSGMDIIRTMRAEGLVTPFIVASGLLPVAVVVDAMKLGASTVLEKPIDIDDLVREVRQVVEPAAQAKRARGAGSGAGHGNGVASRHAMAAVATVPEARLDRTASPRTQSSGSTAERWAMFVMKALSSQSDPRTMSDWARAVSVSRSALCEYCRLVHVSPHDARDFVRVVRAICLSGPRWQPEAVMDVADARTLKNLLRRAGLIDLTRSPTLDLFFERQALIPGDNPGLIALRVLLALSA